MFLSSGPSPSWAALNGSDELGSHSSLQHHEGCCYPIPNDTPNSSPTPSDSDNILNITSLTSSINGAFPSSKLKRQHSGSSADEEGDTSDIPKFQSCVQEPQVQLCGCSSPPPPRPRELMRTPQFGDASCQRSSEVVANSRHYDDIRQSFSDDSSPTPVRNSTHDQRDEQERSMSEKDTRRTSVTGEEQKRNLALGHNDREGSLTDDDPGTLSTASVKGSSGDDGVDTEPLFKKVILKKRRVESRRLVHGGGELKACSYIILLFRFPTCCYVFR